MSPKRHTVLTAWFLTVLVAATLLAVRPLGAAPPAGGRATPAEDPFYRAPDPLPDGPPGTVIRSRAVDVRSTPIPVDAWHILYLSRSAREQPVAVSGTVLVPRRAWRAGIRPLVTYAVGTHGLGDHCAPSYELREGNEGESGMIGEALARGWAVVVTDYEGLGTPGTHTYAVGQSEGRAVLDAARAALALPAAALEGGGPVAIWGYSQGGQAAATAAELAPTYAPELPIVGVAAGGVPADLVAVTRHLDGGPAVGLVLGGAVGYATAYPDIGLEAILNDAGRAAARQIAQACTEEMIAPYSYRRVADYTTVDDPLAEPRLTSRLAENRLGGRAPSAAVLLYHGTADDIIPVELGEQLASEYRAGGVPVEWRPLPLLGHVAAAGAGAPIAVSWLEGRFSAPGTGSRP